MDFMLGLLHTLKKHDSIFVEVNRFFKMAHFILCTKTLDTSKVAKLYFDKVVKLYGLPKAIVSVRYVSFLKNPLAHGWYEAEILHCLPPPNKWLD
jgi:hypothetical protein